MFQFYKLHVYNQHYCVVGVNEAVHPFVAIIIITIIIISSSSSSITTQGCD